MGGGGDHLGGVDVDVVAPGLGPGGGEGPGGGQQAGGLQPVQPGQGHVCNGGGLYTSYHLYNIRGV